jgi:hypothetical protein
MSFLPFVLSFLLILVLGSSLLFTSFRSTSLEKTIILAQNRAKLSLISKQAVEDYKSSRIRKPTKKKPDPRELQEKKEKIPIYKDKRNIRYGLESSKFNLWPLFKENGNAPSSALYKSAIRLIQILYQDADFYKAAHDLNLAKNILDEMINKKAEDFNQLFSENELLAGIYYKMLKGTNTGYPSLREYFKIEKSNNPPVQWAYASTPILQAILGDDATNRVLAAEKASWEANHRQRILTEEKLRTLLQNHSNPDFDISNLKTFFWFDKKGKGSLHTYIEDKSKVMATR